MFKKKSSNFSQLTASCDLGCNIIGRFVEKIFKGQDHLAIKSSGVTTGEKSVLNFF